MLLRHLPDIPARKLIETNSVQSVAWHVSGPCRVSYNRHPALERHALVLVWKTNGIKDKSLITTRGLRRDASIPFRFYLIRCDATRAANSRSLRMTNANTLTTKTTSLSFKRNLKSPRVYFQMSNPLILYAKKSLALLKVLRIVKL